MSHHPIHRHFPILRLLPDPVTWAIRLLAVTLLLPASGAEAQTIRGTVSDIESGRPVASALIRLLDSSGTGVAVAAADSLGRFQVIVPATGRYRVRAEQLGYESRESDPIQVRTLNEDLSVELRLRATPIPIQGVEVSTDQVNRRLRQFLGMSPGQLRVRPVRRSVINDHANRGNDLTEMMSWLQIPNLQTIRSREGPCYQIRGRGCLPVYLDGARLNRGSISLLPLEMLSTIVVLLPNEAIAYPMGAVHLFSTGFMR